MNKDAESEKVIVLNAKTLKSIRLIFRVLLSIIAAILCSLAIWLYFPYSYYEYRYPFFIYNNYNLYRLILSIIFFFASGRIKSIVKLFKGFWRFNQNNLMKSLGVEIFVANIYSLIAASLVFIISYSMSYRETLIFNIPTAVFFAVPAYVLVLHLMTRRKIKYIHEIAEGVLEISKGNLDFKVAEKGSDELKILAVNINGMSAELKKRIEDERRAEKTKNELVTNVSHDLKTPLTTIIGYLTLVKDKQYDNEKIMHDYVERAYSKSLRLKKLIEDLFEYTKLSNGVIRVNRKSINLIELMEQLLGEMSILLKQNGLSLEKNYSDSEIFVNIDSDLMARTFENIISNAVKYSYKELDSKIYVNVVKTNDRVTISVENSGDTIPTEILPLLFERFYRGDKSRNSKISGSGLGLAIAKSIVELHDGTIHAESEANRVKVSVVLGIK